MLAIACGLMARRKLLLEEPSLGLAPRVNEKLLTQLERLRGETVTPL